MMPLFSESINIKHKDMVIFIFGHNFSVFFLLSPQFSFLSLSCFFILWVLEAILQRSARELPQRFPAMYLRFFPGNTRFKHPYSKKCLPLIGHSLDTLLDTHWTLYWTLIGHSLNIHLGVNIHYLRNSGGAEH